MDRDTRRLKAVFLFSAAIAFAVSPFFVTGFNGFDPTDFPVPQEDPPVQPAGYAFSIWGPIYLWLIVHGGWGLFARSDDAGWDAPRWPLTGSLALGASWLAVANAAPLAATVQIWAMLLLALMALFRTPPRQERWLLSAPVALYAGWLTAASWVSVGLVLAGYGLTGQTLAALMALTGAVATGLIVQMRLGRAPLYGAAIVWALVAVVVANASGALSLALVAALGAGAVGYVALRAARQASAVAS